MRCNIALLFIVMLCLATVPTSAQSVQDGATCTTNCAYLPVVVRPVPTLVSDPSTGVAIKSARVLYSSLGSLYVVGELENRTESKITFGQVIARYYDSVGNLVATEDSYAFLTALVPSQRSPFRLILSNPPTNIAQINLTTDWNTDSFLDYQMATVISVQTRDNNGLELFGEIRNDQGREMRSIEIDVTFYDASGRVIDVDFAFPAQTTLAPGAVTTYRVSTFEEELLGVTNYSIQAQGYLAP